MRLIHRLQVGKGVWVHRRRHGDQLQLFVHDTRDTQCVLHVEIGHPMCFHVCILLDGQYGPPINLYRIGIELEI